MKIFFENSIKKETAYFKQKIIKINKSNLNDLILFAKDKNNRLKKSRLCCHNNVKDAVHEMIIYHEKNYYVRPHKHPSKSESVHIIKGKVDIIIFDDYGNIIDIVKLGDFKSKKEFYYRLNCDYFHMLIIKSKFLIFHETSPGPFKKSNTKFAKWSPKIKKSTFNQLIKNKIKIYESLQKKKKLQTLL